MDTPKFIGNPDNVFDVLLAMAPHWDDAFRMSFPELTRVHQDDEVVVFTGTRLPAMLRGSIMSWIALHLALDAYAFYSLEHHRAGSDLYEEGDWTATGIPGPFSILTVNQRIQWTVQTEQEQAPLEDLVPSLMHAWQLLEKNEAFFDLIHADQPGFNLDFVRRTRQALRQLHDRLSE